MVQRHRNRQVIVYTVGLIAIALFTFHALSSIIFSLLGLAPSDPQWIIVLVLGSFLAIAGATIGLQSFPPLKKYVSQRLMGLLSGASSMTILGSYIVSQLSGKFVQGAIMGAVIGLVIGGRWGVWAASRQGFSWVAIALISSLCAYGVAFGLSSWTFAALNTQHWFLAMGLGLLAAIYLWFTQQTLTWVYYQWQNKIKMTIQDHKQKR